MEALDWAVPLWVIGASPEVLHSVNKKEMVDHFIAKARVSV
jgi:hypothetical protein